MQNSTSETLVGLVVVAILAGVLFLAYTSTGRGNVAGYEVKAAFTAVDGVALGTDVRLNGIKIGTVTAMDLNPKTYQAVLHLNVRNDVPLPEDSSAKITSAGLLGATYIAVTPGGSDRMLASGDTITNTQGSVDLMGLVGRFIYGNSGSK